jgi:hypothetical protein
MWNMNMGVLQKLGAFFFYHFSVLDVAAFA